LKETAGLHYCPEERGWMTVENVELVEKNDFGGRREPEYLLMGRI
jgi:hypothetical protein